MRGEPRADSLGVESGFRFDVSDVFVGGEVDDTHDPRFTLAEEEVTKDPRHLVIRQRPADGCWPRDNDGEPRRGR
jgi:hypothetical protein